MNEEIRQDGEMSCPQEVAKAELEVKLQAQLAAEKERLRREADERVRKAREEAEALARMSGEERMAHEFSHRSAELDKREKEILRRELRAEAMRMIEERGLPRELAEVVDCASQERVVESLDVAEQAFRAAVQRGVEERMRGSAPAAGRREVKMDENDEDYYRAHYQSGRKERMGG